MPHFSQIEYPVELYHSELAQHNQSLAEYHTEINAVMAELVESNRPNLDLYKQQPYLTFSIRLKLIDFLLKMSIRLKILPFVLFKAVRIFDRYCSKRIVLLDQSQLIITTCLWVAAKLQGGNNHFVNLNNLDKLTSIKTINDLGYGSGGKYLGPTERFRLPKLHELVKLCGAKCKYDQGMFKQMELHVLTTLDWSLNDPSIEEYIVQSHEFCVGEPNEMFKVKEYLSYVALYSFELIDVDLCELSVVIMDLVSECFGTNQSQNGQHPQSSSATAQATRANLIKSVLNSSDFILKLFCSKGPQHLYKHISNTYGSTPHLTPRKRSITISPSSMSNSPIQSFTSPAFNSNLMKHSSPQQFHNQYQMNTPPPARSIPPLPSFNSPKVFKAKYRSPGYKYKIPHGPSNHNGSAASLTSVSSSHENGDIFEFDYRKNGVSTPLSESESPMFLKQQVGF